MSGDAAWRHSARCIYCFYSWCWSLDFTESESGNFTRKWKLDSFRSPVSFLTMRPTTPAQQSRFGQGTCAHECLGSVLWALESTWVRIMLNWRGLLSHRYNFDLMLIDLICPWTGEVHEPPWTVFLDAYIISFMDRPLKVRPASARWSPGELFVGHLHPTQGQRQTTADMCQCRTEEFEDLDPSSEPLALLNITHVDLEA